MKHLFPVLWCFVLQIIFTVGFGFDAWSLAVGVVIGAIGILVNRVIQEDY